MADARSALEDAIRCLRELPYERCAAMLDRAGLASMDPEEPHCIPPRRWGFARVLLPSAQGGESTGDGAASAAAPAQPWVQELPFDRMFASPDSLDAMADEYGRSVESALAGLAGSCLSERTAKFKEEERARALKQLRADLRAAVAREWSSEAVRRGTAHARAGDFAAALRCYSQALDVDPLNADAHVAVGAAMANGGELERAARRFALALEVDPEHKNARAYLDRVVERLKERGVDTDALLAEANAEGEGPGAAGGGKKAAGDEAPAAVAEAGRAFQAVVSEVLGRRAGGEARPAEGGEDVGRGGGHAGGSDRGDRERRDGSGSRGGSGRERGGSKRRSRSRSRERERDRERDSDKGKHREREREGRRHRSRDEGRRSGEREGKRHRSREKEQSRDAHGRRGRDGDGGGSRRAGGEGSQSGGERGPNNAAASRDGQRSQANGEHRSGAGQQRESREGGGGDVQRGRGEAERDGVAASKRDEVGASGTLSQRGASPGPGVAPAPSPGGIFARLGTRVLEDRARGGG